jgi:hypothetical protein
MTWTLLFYVWASLMPPVMTTTEVTGLASLSACVKQGLRLAKPAHVPTSNKGFECRPAP